jgi:hypothetical protein
MTLMRKNVLRRLLSQSLVDSCEVARVIDLDRRPRARSTEISDAVFDPERSLGRLEFLEHCEAEQLLEGLVGNNRNTHNNVCEDLGIFWNEECEPLKNPFSYQNRFLIFSSESQILASA